MGRFYTVTFNDVAVTASQDLFEIQPADDRPVKIWGLFLTQSTELADAAEEQLRVAIIRGHTTSGSGGNAATPAVINPLDTAAGFTAEVNSTTIASAGTGVTLHVMTWNVRSGLEMWWLPETGLIATQANTTIVVRLLAAPADSVSVSGTLYVEEMA